MFKRLKSILHGLLLLFVATAQTWATEWQYESVFSLPAWQNGFLASLPTINQQGAIAYLVAGSHISGSIVGEALVVDHEGTQSILDLYDLKSGFRTLLYTPVINDSGVVAVLDTNGGFSGADGGIYLVYDIATNDFEEILNTNTDGVTGDVKAVEQFHLNNNNQVAAIVTLNSGQTALILADAAGFQVLDVQDPGYRYNFLSFSLNDDGVVAFTSNTPGPQTELFTVSPISAPSVDFDVSFEQNNAFGPDINESGLIVIGTLYGVYTGRDGAIESTVVDPVTSPFPFSFNQFNVAINDQDDVVFLASTNDTSGLYSGDDPVSDKIIQEGDALFGGIVGGAALAGPSVRWNGKGTYNDSRQLVFRATVLDPSGDPTTYIIMAEPVSTDSDGDGVNDEDDICPGGDDNIDSDGDLVPDDCDPCAFDADNDADGDGVCGDTDVCSGGDDNLDLDLDGTPDFCDACPQDPENDADGDGVCEADDNCEVVWNPGQFDTDGDSYGDACDPDNDNDGILNDEDNCPFIANAGQEDGDGDGAGDVCDDDFDGDGVIDSVDQCLDTVPGDVVNSAGCSIADLVPCEHPDGGSKWKNHGGYVRSVAHAAEDFVDAGLITETEKDVIVSEASQSECGH